MRTEIEYGRRVVYLPSTTLVSLLRPFFRASMPERGGILRIGGKRLGPVVRGPYGLF